MGVFEKIDIDSWQRKPYFDLYFNQMKCTYSVTVNMDITGVIRFKEAEGVKLYPLLISALARSVNNHKEFRTAMDSCGNIGIWDVLHPCYTIFHKETETFSNIWTEWNGNFETFLKSWSNDIERFGNCFSLHAKLETPENAFPVSSIPWTTFTGFNLNITSDGKYLLPIFTFGRYFEVDGKILIPLSIQVHHAVCDGFHVSRLIKEIQQTFDSFE